MLKKSIFYGKGNIYLMEETNFKYLALLLHEIQMDGGQPDRP